MYNISDNNYRLWQPNRICLASFAVLAGVLSALYGLDWYKNRKQNRKVARRKEEVEDYNAEQLLA